MKKMPMMLLLIAPYALIVSCFLEQPIITDGISGVGFVLFAAVLLLNMIYAFMLPHLGFEGKQILFWNMLLKLCNIPVFLLVFLIVLLTHVLILPLIPLLFLFDYFLLLPSTMYGISGMLSCYRSRNLSLTTLIVNAVAQFIFCVDVLSAVYCYMKVRRSSQI